MKQRLFLCLLLALALLYYALPRLAFTEGVTMMLFSVLWVFLAFCVVGGNMIGLLYSEKHRKTQHKNKRIQKNNGQPKRLYGLE